eukprot:CAMPEP_0170435962 /NCGR_PEP_ID=MMETSP0117_2-20130122/43884_1 /TAXON_ID=400756 /ORGANISM="Durinskia baltica, Strain CSIRO CS-38" /LENGTH=33 /DNA_ID= /DNA_START= /DNA_END= /DNA_ORIENTATION=
MAADLRPQASAPTATAASSTSVTAPAQSLRCHV